MNQTEQESFFKTVDCHPDPSKNIIRNLHAIVMREIRNGGGKCSHEVYLFILWVALKAYNYGKACGIRSERSRRKNRQQKGRRQK